MIAVVPCTTIGARLCRHLPVSFRKTKGSFATKLFIFNASPFGLRVAALVSRGPWAAAARSRSIFQSAAETTTEFNLFGVSQLGGQLRSHL